MEGISVVPTFTWRPSNEAKAPRKTWVNKEVHKQFFEKLKDTLGIKDMDDWYNIKQGDIHKHDGSSLLTKYYNGSPSTALLNIYPEHEWMLWKFGSVPSGYWKQKQNQKQF